MDEGDGASKKRKRSARAESEDGAGSRSRSRSHSHLKGVKSRDVAGLRDLKQEKTAQRKRQSAELQLRQHGRAGTADRVHTDKMPKHLFSGKRGIGKTDRR